MALWNHTEDRRPTQDLCRVDSGSLSIVASMIGEDRAFFFFLSIAGCALLLAIIPVCLDVAQARKRTS